MRRVDIQADSRLTFLAVPATAASDVEGHGYEVTDLVELHITAGFNHFTGNFVTENQSCGGQGSCRVLCAGRYRGY